MFNISLEVGNFAKHLEAYREQCNGANDEGVKAMASALRNQARKEFAHEGHGRTYLSRKNRNVRKLTAEATKSATEVRRLQQAVGAGKGSQGVTNKLSNQRSHLAGVTRRLTKALKSQQSQGLGLHHASAVGESPAQDVGTIVAGIQAGVTDGERRVGDVGRWGGWRALHDGGGRLTGARPYLENALAKVRGKLGTIYATVMRKQLDATS